MPNHVHLIVTPADEDGLRRTFGEAHRRYTGAINARFRWTGHLFQGRFGAVVMDEPHLLAAARYIALNPVVAGLVSHAGDWHGRAHARVSRARTTTWQRWRRCARWSPILLPFSPHRPIPRRRLGSSGRPRSDDRWGSREQEWIATLERPSHPANPDQSREWTVSPSGSSGCSRFN